MQPLCRKGCCRLMSPHGCTLWVLLLHYSVSYGVTCNLTVVAGRGPRRRPPIGAPRGPVYLDQAKAQMCLVKEGTRSPPGFQKRVKRERDKEKQRERGERESKKERERERKKKKKTPDRTLANLREGVAPSGCTRITYSP